MKYVNAMKVNLIKEREIEVGFIRRNGCGGATIRGKNTSVFRLVENRTAETLVPLI